jgi:hypothetical protein
VQGGKGSLKVGLGFGEACMGVGDPLSLTLAHKVGRLLVNPDGERLGWGGDGDGEACVGVRI